ncbi:MAG: enoyl-CoA hydratase-related protein [Myxococcota bacterium]|jgi:enoyl-CoA hydratase|nr:enoyl-CoA hydratase-related protein [Myxococcota bacterium]
MTYQNVITSQEGPLRFVRVNRPDKLNALDRATLEELLHVFGEVEADEEVKVVIFGGEGRAFIAGADIAAMQALSPAEALLFAGLGHELTARIEELRCPVIAAVNGFAFGGGTELALACDFIHASTEARFGLPEVKLGIFPGFGGTQRLPRRVGRAMAAELIFSGRVCDAAEALRIGLANAVHEPAELLPAVTRLAQEIAARGPLAVQAAKRLVRVGEGLPLPAANDLEREAFGELFATHDQQEGMAAFLAKRPPVFTGR